MTDRPSVYVYTQEQIEIINQLYKEDPTILTHPNLLDIINNVRIFKPNTPSDDVQEAYFKKTS